MAVTTAFDTVTYLTPGNSLRAAQGVMLMGVSTPTGGRSTPGLLPVDVLATPLRMTPQTLGSTSQSITLGTTVRRVSVDVTVSAIVRINAAASVPANGTSLADAIAIPANATKDFDVPANAVLHFIRDGAEDGTIRITELL